MSRQQDKATKFFTNYTIVNGRNPRRILAQSDLEKQVLAFMEEGWIPLGGVTYLGTETILSFTCQVFCQAMGRPATAIDVAEVQP